MAEAHTHSHDHDHSRDHSHGHGHAHHHDHAHTHGPSSPHPSQPVPWSMLRMSLGGRLLVAATVSLVLWGAVLLAMR